MIKSGVQLLHIQGVGNAGRLEHGLALHPLKRGLVADTPLPGQYIVEMPCPGAYRTAPVDAESASSVIKATTEASLRPTCVRRS